MCKRIGELNRYGEEKTMTCIEYDKSDHKLLYNSSFGKDDYCNECRKIGDVRMKKKLLIRIQQFAHNPNADFSIQIWDGKDCVYKIVCDEYEFEEDVQDPQFTS